MSQDPDQRISTADSLRYWESISTTVDGMLGGYPHISRVDLKGSANFLAKVRRAHPPSLSSSGIDSQLRRAVDCGAGIGRVTAGFLTTVCEIVDIVEPIEKFAEKAKGLNATGNGSVGNMYVTGLETWQPQERYDLIWNQWCLGHLNDQQLIDHLKRCKESLTIDGWIVIKENMSTDLEGQDIFDETDSSVTRAHQKFLNLFKEADVRLIKTEIQRGFPKSLYPVRMYALRP
ncbi:hypothetical protein ACLMJK_006008 [Lecanora helva]